MEKIDSTNDQKNTDTENNGGLPIVTKLESTISNDPKTYPPDESNEKPDPKNKWISCLGKPSLTDWLIVIIMSYFQLDVAEKSDETSRLRDRAYVYFSTPSFTPYPSKDNPTEWIFKVAFHNSGNMPAQSLNIRYTVIDSPTPTDIAPITQAKWTQANTPKTFGPKQDFLFQLFDVKIITIDEFRKMKKSGSMGKFILAEATYFDGFSKEQRVTKMGVRLNIDTIGAHSFSFTHNYNCTDDDCN